MDDTYVNKSIFPDTEVEKPDSLDSSTSRASCKVVKSDVFLIEKELSNSLMLIESGLINLEIEAAHLLNPSGCKNSYVTGEEFSTNQIKPPIEISEKKKADSLHNFPTISKMGPLPYPTANGRINIPCPSEPTTESKAKDVSNPPDLRFTFYSSTEDIIPLVTLMPAKSSSESSALPFNNVIYPPSPSCPTLEEILSNTSAQLISERVLNLQTSEEKEQLYSESKLEAANNRPKPSNRKTESDDSFIEMQDLVESLSKIKSALANLDKEAAHLLNLP